MSVPDYPNLIISTDTTITTYAVERTYVLGRADEELIITLMDTSGAEIRDLIYNVDWLDGYPMENTTLLSNQIRILSNLLSDVSVGGIKFTYVDHVYLTRESNLEPFHPTETTDSVKEAWIIDQSSLGEQRLYARYPGRFPLNFAWFHFSPRLHLIDPAASNIIDMYIITRGYYLELRRWIEGRIDTQPTEPTPLELRTAYAELLNNKMISDTVIPHSGKFKILFGSKAQPTLKAKFVIVRPSNSGNLTDNEVKVQIVNTVRNYFNIDEWEFGETFFFSELSATIHSTLGPEIDSVVLVPLSPQNQFGDLYQIQSREDELFLPDISTADIEIVQSYTPENIRQNLS